MSKASQRTRTRARNQTSRSGRRGYGRGGERLATAFSEVEQLPVLSETRERLHRVIGKPGAGLGEIADVVESDVALAAAVMRAANNGMGPGPGTVSGVSAAIEVLTPRGIRTVANGLESYELLRPVGAWNGFSDRLRRHATATRHAADQIGDLARIPGQEELAVAAVLHDIGRLVLARLYAGYLDMVTGAGTPEERVRWERRELGVDHALIGGVLARRWGIPRPIAAAIERHHAPDATGLAAAVRLADQIAHHAHGDPVSTEKMVEMAGQLGIGEDQLRELLAQFPYGVRSRTRATEPCPLSPRELDSLRGLAEGKVYKQIADEMALSTSTVRTHLHNVYRKLGAADRAQAVLIARDRGWI